MNTSLVIENTHKIRSKIQELETNARQTLQTAIELGGLLCEQKELLPHGEFLPWLDKNISMSQQSASRYMRLWAHKNKLLRVGNLQEAYQQIETLERQEKEQQLQDDLKIVHQRKETGEKPEGWDRRHDYLYRKVCDDSQYEARKQEMFRQKQAEEQQETAERDRIEQIFETVDSFIDRERETAAKRESLRLNDRAADVTQEIIFNTVEDFILSADDVSAQIQRGNNLLKKIRQVVTALQRQTVAS